MGASVGEEAVFFFFNSVLFLKELIDSSVIKKHGSAWQLVASGTVPPVPQRGKEIGL